ASWNVRIVRPQEFARRSERPHAHRRMEQSFEREPHFLVTIDDEYDRRAIRCESLSTLPVDHVRLPSRTIATSLPERGLDARALATTPAMGPWFDAGQATTVA